jgi:hypothetical protein
MNEHSKEEELLRSPHQYNIPPRDRHNQKKKILIYAKVHSAQTNNERKELRVR